MFYFTNKQGKRIEYDTSSIIALHSNVASPEFEVITETTDTGYTIVLDKVLKPRSINIEFLLKAEDFNDNYLLRDELYSVLTQEEELYFHESAIPYKRWRVLPPPSVMGDKGYRFNHFTMTLVAIHGYSESIATTMNKYEFSEDVWQFGMNLAFEMDDYIHNSTRFTINNLGNVKIDPRHRMELDIKIIGASNNIEVINHTTGDTWSYKGQTSKNDILVLSGINAYLNGNKIPISETNKGIITLKRGINDIEIKGATSTPTVTFDNKFYFY